jgi:hypothetical protein
MRSTPAQTQLEGRFPVFFESCVSMIALPDLGADDNVLPRSLLSQLEADGNFVPLRTLAQPVSIDLAVQTPGQSIVVRQQAQLTVELQLPAGPLRLRNVRWLVADQEMDEVLLGRPLLKELGLDAPSHLSANRQEYHDMDCAHVPSAATGGKLSRVIIRADEALIVPAISPSASTPSTAQFFPSAKQWPNCVQLQQPAALVQPFPGNSPREVLPTIEHNAPEISPRTDIPSPEFVYHGETDVDPVELPSLIPLPSTAPGSEIDVTRALHDMIEKAASNGLNAGHLPELRSLVREYRDIWRIARSGGPPADLLPLHIKLKSGAKPVRTKLRRYPQPQKDFLTRFVNELVGLGLAYRNPRAT